MSLASFRVARERLWQIRSIHREVVWLTYITSGRERERRGWRCEGVREGELKNEKEESECVCVCVFVCVCVCKGE